MQEEGMKSNKRPWTEGGAELGSGDVPQSPLPPAQHRAIMDVIDSMVEDCIFEEAMEVNWRIRTGQWTMDDIYGVKPLSSVDGTSKKKSTNPSNNTSSSNNQASSSSATTTTCYSAAQRAVVCSLCGEVVAGSRYAPHLEKCMNGGKRGTKKHFDSLQDVVYLKAKYKKEVVDPFPNSMIVRVRLKNGVPYGNTKRIGISEEEFKAAQELNNAANNTTPMVAVTQEGTIEDDSLREAPPPIPLHGIAEESVS